MLLRSARVKLAQFIEIHAGGESLLTGAAQDGDAY